MDTSTAITILTTASQNLGAQTGQLITQQAAVDFAISVLKGTLQTQLADLEAAQATIATLTTALEDNNIALPADTPVEAAPE